MTSLFNNKVIHIALALATGIYAGIITFGKYITLVKFFDIEHDSVWSFEHAITYWRKAFQETWFYYILPIIFLILFFKAWKNDKSTSR